MAMKLIKKPNALLSSPKFGVIVKPFVLVKSIGNVAANDGQCDSTIDVDARWIEDAPAKEHPSGVSSLGVSVAMAMDLTVLAFLVYMFYWTLKTYVFHT